jgi:hypothetical protein
MQVCNLCEEIRSKTHHEVRRVLTNKDECEGHSQQGKQAVADANKCGKIVEVARSSSLNLGILWIARTCVLDNAILPDILHSRGKIRHGM